MDGADVRTKDRSIAAMVEGLRTALTDPAKEHRLFRSGKLRGLFGGRNGIPGDAAAEAMRLGYIDLVKTEQKGLARIEWVRLTDRGVEFLYEHDTPRAILTELHATLQSTRRGVPGWLTAVAEQLTALGERFTHEMQRLPGEDRCPEHPSGGGDTPCGCRCTASCGRHAGYSPLGP